MNMPGQDKEDLAEIKWLLKEYRVLRTNQLYAYFQDKEQRVVANMLSFLRRGGQLISDPSGEFLALNKPELKNGLDEKVISAFWVLLKFGGSTEYHARTEYPAQIFFFCEGTEYEVIYASYGNEAMLNAVFARREPDDTHFLVIVETPEQIESLDIPQTDWFCTVDAQGLVHRYVQEESE